MDLGRRLVSALMLVPEDEREAVVRAIEKQIIAEFGGWGSDTRLEQKGSCASYDEV
jgi:hypothetical protein